MVLLKHITTNWKSREIENFQVVSFLLLYVLWIAHK